jgi:type II secretory pathway component GspD/PulD (secretin)
VLIKANILQVDLKDDCRSGVNLEQLVSFSGNELKLSSVGLANSAASPASFLTLTGGSLDGLVELLKTTTDAKSLASTELLTVSGQEARIQSGQRLGFRVTTTTQTSSLESVEFIEVGVLLTVTPQVTRDGRILLRIQPKVSDGQVDPATGLPTEDTVEVATDLLLNNGQGLVIGGLIQEVDSNVQSKVPWLGDIPYAGVLFQKRQLIKARSEIIVTLIPHVMPYTPIEIAHNDQRMLRTQDPLLAPPLNRFPRPYEPQLPDTFTNPTPVFPHWHYRRAAKNGTVADVATLPTPSEMTTLPTVLDPVPAVEEGPLCYPPVGAQQPVRVPQQAARDFPTYR